jgi:Ceramidase
MRTSQFHLRLFLLLGSAVVAVVIMLLVVPPFEQPRWYHDFADQRCLCGIPHALNVVSNLPFVVVGMWGVCYLLCQPRLPGVQESYERWTYLFFFLFIALTGVGSAYYHSAPDNDRLLWDRLPLAVAIMTLFALLIGEHIDRRAGPWLLVPLVVAGAGSVIYWHLSERWHAGDLRPYLLVQFLPLLLLPFILFLFPSRYTRSGDVGAMLACYVVAKILEILDREFYECGQIVSGHTLKHVTAGFGAYMVLHMIQRRRPVVADMPAF